MGSAASTPKNVQHKLLKSEQEIVRLMLPVYYDGSSIDAAERKLALDAWNLIIDDKSPVFLERRGKSDFSYQSCVSFFYDTFYTRLFDIHPMCRHMFKGGMRTQGKFLVKMISLALSEIHDPEKFDQNLTKLAEVHYERGVKAVEYGVVGEVLFYVLKACLGPTIYIASVHRAWVKVYSRMLTTIVPVAISMELKHNSPALQTRTTEMRSSFMFSAAQTAAFSDAVQTAQEEAAEGPLKSEKIRRGEPIKSVD